MTFTDDQLVPGGIRDTDIPHYRTDDGRCSRCGEIDDDDVPLLVWAQGDTNLMWRFCSGCMGWTHPTDETIPEIGDDLLRGGGER